MGVDAGRSRDPAAVGEERRAQDRPIPATELEKDLLLDPELRDDEPLPEPLDGSAERYWAPFVLVGG